MSAVALPSPENPFPWGRVDESELLSRCPAAGDDGDLPLAISCLDLTSLNATDTPDTIRILCALAKANGVAGVCVFPTLVSIAAKELSATGIKVITAAGGFPFAMSPLKARIVEIEYSIENGAEEIDLAINRSAFLSREFNQVFDELCAIRVACSDKTMKVILETGELCDLNDIRNASFIAMQAGADFIKTSTGKTQFGATPEHVLCIADAIRDYCQETGKAVGIKPSGGIRTAKDAIRYVATVRNALGEEWLNPNLFRIGASRIFETLG